MGDFLFLRKSGSRTDMLVLEPRQLLGAALCSLIARLIPEARVGHTASPAAATKTATSVVVVGPGVRSEEKLRVVCSLRTGGPARRVVVLGAVTAFPAELRRDPAISLLLEAEDTPPEVLRRELQRHLISCRTSSRATSAGGPETRLLELIGLGKTNREIGEVLCLAESTVKWHIQKLCRQYDARNRVELLNRRPPSP